MNTNQLPPPAGRPINPHPSQPTMTTQEQRNWAAAAHASTVVALLLSVGSASFLGPLIIWAMKKQDPFVRESAARAFNFNVVLAVLNIVAWVLLITVILSPVAVVIFVLVAVMTVWFHLRAALAARRGELYSYPWQVALIH